MQCAEVEAEVRVAFWSWRADWGLAGKIAAGVGGPTGVAAGAGVGRLTGVAAGAGVGSLTAGIVAGPDRVGFVTSPLVSNLKKCTHRNRQTNRYTHTHTQGTHGI